MAKLKNNTVGLILGTFTGGLHLIWAMIVLLGFAQKVIDWIYWLHFLNNPFLVATFSLERTILLVLFTFVMGYLAGWLFTSLWNKMCSK